MSTSENPCRILYVRRVGLKRLFIAALVSGTAISWICAAFYAVTVYAWVVSEEAMRQAAATMLGYIFIVGPTFAIAWTIMAAFANSVLASFPLRLEVNWTDGTEDCQEGGERQADRHD